jgi:hypothetical protein
MAVDFQKFQRFDYNPVKPGQLPNSFAQINLNTNKNSLLKLILSTDKCLEKGFGLIQVSRKALKPNKLMA